MGVFVSTAVFSPVQDCCKCQLGWDRVVCMMWCVRRVRVSAQSTYVWLYMLLYVRSLWRVRVVLDKEQLWCNECCTGIMLSSLAPTWMAWLLLLLSPLLLTFCTSSCTRPSFFNAFSSQFLAHTSHSAFLLPLTLYTYVHTSIPPLPSLPLRTHPPLRMWTGLPSSDSCPQLLPELAVYFPPSTSSSRSWLPQLNFIFTL